MTGSMAWVGPATVNRGVAHAKTRPARRSPWKDIGTMEGDVPASCMRDCISADNLVPYSTPAVTRCVLPIRGDARHADRRRFRFWRDAQGQYDASRGPGAGTPKALEANPDYNGKPTGGRIVRENKWFTTGTGSYCTRTGFPTTGEWCTTRRIT